MLRNVVENHYNTETQLQSTRANNSSPVLTAWGCSLWRLLWNIPLSCLHFQEVGGLAQTDHLVGSVFWSQIQPVKCLLGAIFLGKKLSVYRLLCGRSCRITAVWNSLECHLDTCRNQLSRGHSHSACFSLWISLKATKVWYTFWVLKFLYS